MEAYRSDSTNQGWQVVSKYVESLNLPSEAPEGIPHLLLADLTPMFGVAMTASWLLDPKREALQVTVSLGHPTPPSGLDAVTELIMQLNPDLMYGCFEIYTDEGDVRFRTGVFYKGHNLEPWMIENAYQEASWMARKYRPAFLAVGKGSIGVREALKTMAQ